MKTIYTTLPIYNSLAKQAFERSKRIDPKGTFAIICPIDELPSFQWLDFGDGAITVTSVELIDFNKISIDITSDLPSLPTLHAITGDAYFVYLGGTLDNSMSCGLHYLKITTDNAKVYYSEWFNVQDVYDQTSYSSKYLIIEFSNSLDLGNIYYQSGFTQTAWIESEPMECTYPLEEEGAKDGQSRFIRTFGRQTKKYLAKTCTLPDYMVDVFNRMRLHDTVTLVDLVGDTNDVYNLEVDHEWIGDDKYYAKIELTFDYDETVIVSGCGNNFI